MKNEVRVRAIGDLHRLPDAVRRELERVIELTRDNTPADRRPVRQLRRARGHRRGDARVWRARRRRARSIPRTSISRSFAAALGTAGIPDPDLLIRTSGEMRISNFFLWQLAYTELYVTETLWPDFREQEFVDALVHYQQRERRFGLTSEQQQERERAGAAR